MKINLIDREKVVMSNENSIYGYFGWPTVAKLQNGTVAVVASGYRISHVCPFGKAVISFSHDNGNSFSEPEAVINTCLDDRDSGICPFGKQNVIVTSFNNTVAFQRDFMAKFTEYHTGGKQFDGLKEEYLSSVSESDEENALGVNYRISNDFGKTFGEIRKSPVSSPHGPIQIDENRLLWVGRPFNSDYNGNDTVNLEAYYMDFAGNMTPAGKIDKIIKPNGKECALSCEPHAVLTDDGTVICHIRTQWEESGGTIMTLFQTESHDLGKTWTKPHRITDGNADGPAHLLKHSSGVLVCSYGKRDGNFGANVMFSFDNGKKWGNHTVIYDNSGISSDIGYPSTVELDNGEMLTVLYARLDKKSKNAVIIGRKWSVDFES